MPLTTDLTLYDVCEVMDENRRGTGIYRLVRRSLEPNIPRHTECDHNHPTPQEALVCTYFANEILEAKKVEKPKQEKKKIDQFDLLGNVKADIAA